MANQEFHRNGFIVVRDVFSSAEIADWIRWIDEIFSNAPTDSASIQTKNGCVFAARNILDLFPFVIDQWKKPILQQWVRDELGDQAGLVRGLYFDKPPGHSWSLPWHKDRTLAVKNHAGPSDYFQHPTKKAGIYHVEADRRILDRMLTLRIHLDAADHTNGALMVQVGSHQEELINGLEVKKGETVWETQTIAVGAGDVLAMRPHLNHCSGNSDVDSQQHRQIIHLEFAAMPKLPDGYQWRWFEPV